MIAVKTENLQCFILFPHPLLFTSTAMRLLLDSLLLLVCPQNPLCQLFLLSLHIFIIYLPDRILNKCVALFELAFANNS